MIVRDIVQSAEQSRATTIAQLPVGEVEKGFTVF
jgi:hypothetical protein